MGSNSPGEKWPLRSQFCELHLESMLQQEQQAEGLVQKEEELVPKKEGQTKV